MNRTTLKPGTLRRANTDRQAEWPGGDRVDLYFRAMELAGEAGELVNLLKKQVRLDRDISGTTETQEALTLAIRDEIGDVAVCLDLVGMEFPCALDTAAVFEPDLTRENLSRLAVVLDGKVGWVCETVDDIIETFESGLLQHRNDRKQEMEAALAEASDALENICTVLGLDVTSCTVMKFNATSAKHGLKTRINA